MFQTDVVIIGAGPCGLFSIFECGMKKLQTHVFDTLDMVGGQCAALYPEKPIYDIPAFPSVSGADLIENLKSQAAPFKPQYHLGEQIVKLVKDKDSEYKFTVTGSKGTSVQSKAIIIAAGVGAFGPNRPVMDHLETYESKHVDYFVGAREKYRGKKIVIAGGGDSAVDWALSLHDVAERVSVVHRRAKFRAAPDSEAKLKALAESGKIDLIVPYQLKALHGDGTTMTHVEVATLDGDTKSIEADYLLPFFGLSMNLGPLVEWGLNFDKSQIAISQETSETNIPGVYAVGDIATYPSKLKLILTGFAEGAHAAHAIRRQLFPDENEHFEYSTTKGVPTAA